jgi:two-component system phosphate regulon sensor histidine kinase PhoR
LILFRLVAFLLSSRFFRRIFLPYLLLICTATIVVGAVLAYRVRESYLDRTRETLAREAVLISDSLKADLQRGDVAAVESATRRLGEILKCRVTIIEDDGRVIGDNEADPAQMENHRQRGEVVRADIDGDGFEERSSRTLNQPLMYCAHKLVTADGKVHFVRLSVHISDLNRQLNLIYWALGSVVLIATIAAALLSFYFARRGAAPVLELSEFAQALGRGELHRRLLLPGDGEIGQLAGTLNTMAESVSRLLGQTAKDRAELLAMLGSMSEGVIGTDGKQRVVVVNQRAGELFSFGSAQAQGKMLWEIVREEAVLKAATEVLASGERKAFQISPAAGTYLEITACTYPAGAPAEGLILVAHDTSQSVRYQELRKEFVANVSHELRTPLTVIKGFTETLRDGALQDAVNGPKFLATIERHVDQLTNLVSDLLELSRLESMPDLPNVVPFDLSASVRRVTDLLLPAAQRKKQSLHVETARHIPRLVGNPDYVERAVSNLIDNAIKYTPEGGEIRVSVGMDEQQVWVDVADNGLGIPPEDLARVFERFYRVDRSRSREMGGTGLGLSIVKHVAQSHGGSIDVSSTPGKGSRFRLRLPIPVENG